MPGLLLYPSGADVVGVFDSGFAQVFADARPMRAQIRETQRIMDHPTEKGQIISDYKVVLPIEIQIPFMVAPEFYRDTYQQIKTLYKNSELLFVQTLSDLYDSMVIAEMPHEEDPAFFNSLRIYLRFRQVIVVQSQTSFAPADPTDSNTQSLGVQNPVVITGVATSQGIQTIPLQPNATLASGDSGAITGAQNVRQTPVNAPSPYSISGVATVGGTQTIDAGFQ